MSTRLIIRPEAKADLREIDEYLAEQGTVLGEKFRAELTRVFERIESMPEMFGIVWRDIRATRLRRFKYVVYYVVLSDQIEVLAVVHGARHASRWKARLKRDEE